MDWPTLLVSCLAVAASAWALTWLVLWLLSRQGILDRPNERSSHSVAKPRGAGLALIPVVLGAWFAVPIDLGPVGIVPILAAAGVLAGIGWLDDLRGLPPWPRLLVQALAVALGLYALEGFGPVFQGLLPPLLDRLAAGLVWLWFVNLFNFMDGIDGIAGVEAASIGLGLFLIALIFAETGPAMLFPLLLAAASLGFLAWNWPPSKLFLGDVGSVPLGYLIAWLLLVWAAEGQWAAALILPLYYLADATITLVRRALGGAKVWQAHREHFYQRAVQGGASHARVSLGVLACNLVLVACALVAAGGRPWLGLAAAVAAVAGFLYVLRRWARPLSPAA